MQCTVQRVAQQLCVGAVQTYRSLAQQRTRKPRRRWVWTKTRGGEILGFTGTVSYPIDDVLLILVEHQNASSDPCHVREVSP